MAIPFERRLTQALVDRAYSHALRPVMEASGQLAAGMQKILVTDTHGLLYIPHYWAVYVHDGRRGGFRPRGSGKPPYIWFKNPMLDPRLNSGSSPERYDPANKLTAEQFHRFREQGQLIIRRKIGPTRPKPFFSNDPDGGGMFGYVLEAEREGKDLFRRFVREEALADVLDLKEQVTVSF